MKEQIDVARGISEFGMLAVTAAFFLVLSATMMATIMRFFVKMITTTINDQREILKELSENSRAEINLLSDISEGFRDETLNKIKVLSNALFDNEKNDSCKLLKQVRDENNISDKDRINQKLRQMVRNLHENRNSKFDIFSFRGHRLSTFTNATWVEEMATILAREIYSEDPQNHGRSCTNISAQIENMKLEFYHNIIKGV